MALEEQTLSINYGQGVDTKTDPKLVINGKLLRLENAVFTEAKQITKRNGYDSLPLDISGGGTLTNPMGIHSYNDELVLAATATGAAINGQRLFSFSESLNAWVDKGKYVPTKVTNTIVSNDNQQVTFSGTFLGSYVVSIWVNREVPTTTNCYATVIDMRDKVALLPETPVALNIGYNSGNGVTAVSAVVVAANKVALLYPKTTTSLACKILTISGTSVTIGPEVVLQTDLDLIANGFFAVSNPVGGAAIVYAITPAAGNTDLKTFTIDAAGVITHTALRGLPQPAAALFYMYLNYDSVNARYWVYWIQGTDFGWIVYTSVLTVVGGPFDSSGHGIIASGPISSLALTATTQTLFYTTSNFNKKVSVSSTGVIGTPVQFFANASISSDPFIYKGATYIVMYDFAATQQTGLLVDVGDGRVIAKFLPGSASFPPNLLSGQIPFFITADQVGLIFGFIPDSSTPGALGTVLISFDFADPDLYQAIKAGNLLLWNGGQVMMYDGQAAVELGFTFFPSNLMVTSLGPGGGAIADGTYEYFAIYRWLDAQGNLHQSAPASAIVTVAGGGGTATVAVSVDSLVATDKQSPRFDVQVAFFRTDANGTLAHLLPGPNGIQFPLLNDPTGNTVSFIDTASDASIDNNEIIYTAGGVLENIAPPPTVSFVAHNNRVFLVDSENLNTTGYSKSIAPGFGISFSDLLVIQLDARAGAINALAELDEKLVLLEKDQPFVISGDGANDLGLNATFSFPQQIPTDTGCSGSKGVFTSPLGVHFRSPKGKYILDRGLSVKYWGIEVEGFNTQDVTSGLIMPATNQIRFLTSSGFTLLYDYIFNQWSSFTNHTGLASTNWQGVFVYVRTDGLIFKENTTSFLDNATAFSVRFYFSWLKGNAAQGFQRVRRFLSLGDYKNGVSAAHGVQVSAAYNFVPVYSTPIPYVFGAAVSSGIFQYRERLPIQKCEAVSFLVEEIVTGSSGEQVDFTDMTLEAGVKKGGFKLPAVQSVG